ncbi:MAG: peptidoglycan-binding protein [Bacteroidales bacterium]|nr:peptidoglycan-binding protein [Bacteroidales bacterium]
MEFKKSNNPQFDPIVQAIQIQLNRISQGRWISLKPDGLFGPNTEKAVIAYQKWRGITPPSGIVGDTTYAYLMSERYFEIGPAPNPTIQPVPQPINQGGIGHTTVMKGIDIYNTAETARKTVLDPSKENSIAYMVTQLEKLIEDTLKNLKEHLKQIDVNKRGRVPQLAQKMDNVNKFVSVAKKQGFVIATQQCFGKVTKNGAISYLNEVIVIMEKSNITKIISSASKFFQAINNILKPIYQFMEKIVEKFPPLKYIGAIQKLIDSVWQLILGNSELALARFLECIKEVAEALALTAIIAAIGTSGGWIPIVLIIAVILIALIVDYFFFSSNPGDSLADKYTPLHTRNLAEDFVYATYSPVY